MISLAKGSKPYNKICNNENYLICLWKFWWKAKYSVFLRRNVFLRQIKKKIKTNKYAIKFRKIMLENKTVSRQLYKFYKTFLICIMCILYYLDFECHSKSRYCTFLIRQIWKIEWQSETVLTCK